MVVEDRENARAERDVVGSEAGRIALAISPAGGSAFHSRRLRVGMSNSANDVRPYGFAMIRTWTGGRLSSIVDDRHHAAPQTNQITPQQPPTISTTKTKTTKLRVQPSRC